MAVQELTRVSTARAPTPPGRRRTRRRQALVGYSFAAPAVVLFLVFIGLPFLAAIALSLFQWDLLTPATFIGTDNFVALAHDAVFWKSLGNTFVFAVASVVTHIVLGIVLALVVNRKMNVVVNYFFRTAIFAPFLVSWAAVSLLWKYVLDPTFGISNHYLAKVGIDPPNWLVSPEWALPALIGIDWWHTIGYTFVILLAGLQTVPVALLEAAIVDGATAWQRFWNVTLPSMAPTLVFATVITFIGAFQIFEPMRIITQGGPDNATKSIVLYLYENAFERFQVGYGSAVALVVFVIVMTVTLVQLRVTRKWVDQE